jgi:RNase P/RNase MRP subunit p29
MINNPKLLIYHDLIGFYAFAKPKSKLNDKYFKEIGIIVDETRDMLITEKNMQFKKYIKKDYIFRFNVSKFMKQEGNYYLEVQGNRIVGLPVNRLRSLKKKRWLNK